MQATCRRSARCSAAGNDTCMSSRSRRNCSGSVSSRCVSQRRRAMAESRPRAAAAARLAAIQSTEGSSTIVSTRAVSVELPARAAARVVHACEVNVPCVQLCWYGMLKHGGHVHMHVHLEWWLQEWLLFANQDFPESSCHLRLGLMVGCRWNYNECHPLKVTSFFPDTTASLLIWLQPYKWCQFDCPMCCSLIAFELMEGAFAA
jgi:hypothetical protein